MNRYIRWLLMQHKQELKKHYQQGLDIACWEKYQNAYNSMAMFAMSLFEHITENKNIKEAIFFNTKVICIASIIQEENPV